MQINGTLILLYFKELTNFVRYHPPLFEIKLLICQTVMKFKCH